MKSKIYLHQLGTCGVVRQIPVEIFNFSGGEVQVKIKHVPNESGIDSVGIEAHIHDSDGLMALMLLSDAVDRKYGCKKTLDMPYIPYARQDRPMTDGESLAVKVLAEMINSCKFDKVYVADPHSDVSAALINNVKVKTVTTCLGYMPEVLRDIDCVVAPDAGASKKVFDVANTYGKEYVQGIKHRDVSTGALSGFDYIGDVANKNCLIVDDICDGGGTFIGLAKKLKEGGAIKVDLFVTHGIFAKGKEVLLDNGIDSVYSSYEF